MPHKLIRREDHEFRVSLSNEDNAVLVIAGLRQRVTLWANTDDHYAYRDTGGHGFRFGRIEEAFDSVIEYIIATDKLKRGEEEQRRLASEAVQRFFDRIEELDEGRLEI